MLSERENQYGRSLPGLTSSEFSRVRHHPLKEEIVPFISTTSDFLCRANLCPVGANEAIKCSPAAGGPVCHGGMLATEHLRSHLGACQI